MKCSNEFKQGHSLFQAHLWCHSGNGLLAAWLREYSGFTLEVIYVYAYVLLKEKSMLNSIWKKTTASTLQCRVSFYILTYSNLN